LYHEFEKCIFAEVTVLLAMAVYQIIVSGNLPSNFDSAPIIG